MQVFTEERVPIKIWSSDPDPNAVEQLRNVARLPFIFKHVAAMPDVHWGFGSTVGSVIATQGAVIPSAVGVDIGCGMMAFNTGRPAAEMKAQAAALRRTIETLVPVGFNAHKEQLDGSVRWKGWDKLPMMKSPGGDPMQPMDEKTLKKAQLQHGTLGGGNHFIELCEDESGMAWALLHSGSRGIGKLVADVYMKAAKDQCARHFVELPDKELAFLAEGTREFDDYIDAVTWCQQYAWLNRELMMELVAEALRINRVEVHPCSVHCHHNYVTMEQHFGQNVWLTRKGAVYARAGVKGIIPGSMGTRSYITEGLGNPESFHSSSHGAGRRMGRNEAKRQFTTADLEAQTEGVECRKDEGVLDELPGAYKDIDVVMANQADLVRPIHTLKQFLCVKG